MTQNLDPFFNPRSVAIVGASSRTSSVGHAVLKNLLFGRADVDPATASRDGGFQGKIYAVNHKGEDILGQPSFKSLADIGEPVDLVVVAIPPKYIVGLIDEVAAAQCHHAIIISAGFAELGQEGKALQDEMLAKAKSHDIRLVGPNCLGVLRPSAQLNASFGNAAPPAGSIGLLSQSGALITGLISYAIREKFGLSAAVSLGSKADVEDEDVLQWLGDDPETNCIALYVEAFTEPRSFVDVAAKVSKKKPIVALKGGATSAGAKAASSHTGSLAGSIAAYEAAFAQTGVIQAKNISQFMNWSRALASQPVPSGKRIAVVTNAGGPGVLSADAASRHGVEMATLSADTLAQLNEVLPSVWSHNNPIDVIGDATPERYAAALNILGKAPEVDGIIVIMTVQAMTAPMATAEAILAAQRAPGWNKPLLSSFLGLIGTETGSFLDQHGIPDFNFPEEAVSSMGALIRRGEWLRAQEPAAFELTDSPTPNIDASKRALKNAIASGHKNLPLSQAREVIESCGIRYNQGGTANDAADAVSMAGRIGYPVVVKAISPDILHKSDVGAVALNLADAGQVKTACDEMLVRIEKSQPGARIEGFTVEEFVAGTEVIIGMSRDPSFGPLMMVGMGGIFVEVYKDVRFGLLPITRSDVHRMMSELQAQPLLDGARGKPVLNRPELAEVVLRIAALVEACPEIEELDLNPMVITPKGLIAIDARVIVANPDTAATTHSGTH